LDVPWQNYNERPRQNVPPSIAEAQAFASFANEVDRVMRQVETLHRRMPHAYYQLEEMIVHAHNRLTDAEEWARNHSTDIMNAEADRHNRNHAFRETFFAASDFQTLTQAEIEAANEMVYLNGLPPMMGTAGPVQEREAGPEHVFVQEYRGGQDPIIFPINGIAHAPKEIRPLSATYPGTSVVQVVTFCGAVEETDPTGCAWAMGRIECSTCRAAVEELIAEESTPRPTMWDRLGDEDEV